MRRKKYQSADYLVNPIPILKTNIKNFKADTKETTYEILRMKGLRRTVLSVGCDDAF